MGKFIDIHTHKVYEKNDIIFIRSFLLNKDEIITNSFFSIGCHPWYSNTFSQDLLNDIIFYCNDSNCLAIGEIGLDKLKPDYPLQRKVFISQLDLAVEKNKPVIIHAVKSYNEILELKKHYSTIPWIIHGFYGSKEIAKQLIDKDIYLSVGSMLLKKNSKLIDVLRNIPLDKVFFETDMWENSVKDIYFAAAEILSIDIEILQNQIKRNFKNVFNVSLV